MKTFALALFAFASLIITEARVIDNDAGTSYTAFDYMAKYGIPRAEKLRKLEEESASRIVGGLPAAPGQYRYQAGLLTSLVGSTGRVVCGGSLVSANRVITAAHCWFDGNNQGWQTEVVLGSTALFTGGVRLFTSVVIMHPNWFPRLIRNDVAVIYLPSSVTFSNLIEPVALPSGAQLNEDFVDERAIASGFGITDDSMTSIPLDQTLQHVGLNIITNAVCSRILVIIQDSNICTSGLGGTSTCSGDSGGPLVVTRDGRAVLVGVVSFGLDFGCASGFPAAYARVTSFMSFFNQHL